MSYIIEKIRSLYQLYLYWKYSKKCKLNGFVYFGRHTKIITDHGSQKNDIIIEKGAHIYGILYSQNKGKIHIKNNAQIGPDAKIYSANHIEIGIGSSIVGGSTVVDNNNHPVNPNDRKIMRFTPIGSEKRGWKYSKSSPIIIGDFCWVGVNTRICKGVTIGNGSIVAACAVVTKDVPENSIVGGNPGKILKTNIDKEERFFND